MKFGLMYLFSDFGNARQDRVFHEALEEIEYAEELGFDSVWLPEHHFSVYGMLGDVLTLAANIAQRTKRMKIGTAVVLLPLNHPVRVAEQAALVDALSNGRLLLGLGRAYQPAEFDGFGVAPEHSREMFLEGLDILEKCFHEESFSYEGKFWKVKDVKLYPKPVQKPRPPIYWAAVTPTSYELAGKMGYPVLRGPNFTGMHLVEKEWQTYCDVLRQNGHDPSQMDHPLMMQTFVAESRKVVEEVVVPHAMWYWKLLGRLLPGGPGKRVESGYELYPKVAQTMEKLTERDLLEWGTCYGTPDEVIERMKLYLQRAGTTHWLSWMKIGGMPHDHMMKSMELFARHVMPALRDYPAPTTH
jgi:alkanesulfonate monooxygenase SsuD/methylene tetrahydromethanopterin reductase-like flavin-dependent oxidoreductase (luciferase family)